MATVTLILVGISMTQSAGAASAATWWVSASGGGDCSQANPCGSIDAAYQRSGAGDSILMAAGSYGVQTVNYRAAANSFATNVVLQPQNGAVSIARLSIQGPHLTVRGVSLTGFTEIVSTPGGNANYGRIENVDSTGQIYITGSDNTAVVNSWIHPGLNSVPIGVTPYNNGTHVPTNTLIENNEVGPAWASSDWQAKGLHNESIHVLGAANLNIRGNLIWEGGTSSSLQIDTSLGSLTGVVVENNYVAGCGLRTPPAGAACAAYYAVGYSNYTGASTSQIILRNNTIRGGIIDYGYMNRNSPAGDASGNVVDATVGCSGAPMHGNLFRPGSFYDCSLDRLAVPSYTTPAYGGVSWGMASGSPGSGLGVPSQAGFRPAPVTSPPPTSTTLPAGTSTTVVRSTTTTVPTATSTTVLPSTTTTVPAATTTTVLPSTTTTVPTATPTTVAPPTTTTVRGTTGSFGATVPGTTRSYVSQGYKFGSVYGLGRSATLIDLKFWAQGGTASQKLTPVIYSVDSNGTPTTLVAQGAEVTVPASRNAGLVTSTLPAITLAPGQYMLALISGPNGGGASVFYTPAVNAGIWNANAYPTPSGLWGMATPEDFRWSFLVDYR